MWWQVPVCALIKYNNSAPNTNGTSDKWNYVSKSGSVAEKSAIHTCDQKLCLQVPEQLPSKHQSEPQQQQQSQL